MQTGTLTKENTEYLSGMRDKMGLSKEQAEKIIKGVQNQRLIGGLEAAKNTGSLSLQKVLDMKESGVEIDSFISEEMRLNLYTKEVHSQTFLCSTAVFCMLFFTGFMYKSPVRTLPFSKGKRCAITLYSK